MREAVKVRDKPFAGRGHLASDFGVAAFIRLHEPARTEQRKKGDDGEEEKFPVRSHKTEPTSFAGTEIRRRVNHQTPSMSISGRHHMTLRPYLEVPARRGW